MTELINYGASNSSDESRAHELYDQLVEEINHELSFTDSKIDKIEIVLDCCAVLEITPDANTERLITVIHPSEVQALTGGGDPCWSITDQANRNYAPLTNEVTSYDPSKRADDVAKIVVKLITSPEGSDH